MQDYGFCFVNFELFWIWKLIFFFFWPPQMAMTSVCWKQREREKDMRDW
jgi:hypothetical protein